MTAASALWKGPPIICRETGAFPSRPRPSPLPLCGENPVLSLADGNVLGENIPREGPGGRIASHRPPQRSGAGGEEGWFCSRPNSRWAPVSVLRLLGSLQLLALPSYHCLPPCLEGARALVSACPCCAFCSHPSPWHPPPKAVSLETEKGGEGAPLPFTLPSIFLCSPFTGDAPHSGSQCPPRATEALLQPWAPREARCT